MTHLIAIESPNQPDVLPLLRAGEAHVAALYPAESNHMLDVSALAAAPITFLVARHDGAIVGCAALVRSGEGGAEVKRMFVPPHARGHGVARLLLAALEKLVVEGGLGLRLETGIRQLETIALYTSAGFVQIGPFGRYRPDPLSVFMEKLPQLTAAP